MSQHTTMFYDINGNPAPFTGQELHQPSTRRNATLAGDTAVQLEATAIEAVGSGELLLLWSTDNGATFNPTGASLPFEAGVTDLTECHLSAPVTISHVGPVVFAVGRSNNPGAYVSPTSIALVS